MKGLPLTGSGGKAQKVFLALLAVVLLGGLVYFALGRQGFNWGSFLAAIRNARFELLLLSFGAIYGCYALRALRWGRFCRYLGPTHFVPLLNATLIGFTALFLLGRAGEPLRPLLIARRERMSVTAMFGIYALERIFDTAATVVLAAASLLLLPHHIAGPATGAALLVQVRAAGAVLLAGTLAATAFLVYFRLHGAGWLERKLAPWHAREGWHARVAGMFDGLSKGLQAIRTFGDLVAAVGYTALHWALVALIYLWVSNAFAGRLATLDMPSVMLVLVITMVGSLLQLPAVGGGSQVASILAFTQVFGVEQEAAAAASITLWLITFAGCGVAGAPLLIREGLSMGQLRKLARAEAEAAAHGTHVTNGAGVERRDS